MRNRFVAIGAIILFVASTGVARADDASDIHALFYRLSRAMSTRDPGGILSLGTPDLTYIDKGKVLIGRQIAQHMEARFRLMQGSPMCRFTVLSLNVKGKSAYVLSSDFTEAELSGGTGRTHRIIASGRSRDELVKSKRGWLLKSVYVLSSSITMDGRPVNTSALGGVR